MLLVIPDVLTPEQTLQCRQALEQAEWEDGRGTAGHVAVRAKRNRQLAADHPLTQRIGELILQALGANPLFLSAVLPLKVFPPRFNRYAGGGHYGHHVDSAVLSVSGTAHRIRTDVSATLFFSEPHEYDGGELVVEDTYGSHDVKLPAGHMVVYPGTSLHKVAPVTRGARLASFFWTQSLVRDDTRRALLFELDRSIQALSAREGNETETARLLGVYHNLLRQWSDT